MHASATHLLALLQADMYYMKQNPAFQKRFGLPEAEQQQEEEKPWRRKQQQAAGKDGGQQQAAPPPAK